MRNVLNSRSSSLSVCRAARKILLQDLSKLESDGCKISLLPYKLITMKSRLFSTLRMLFCKISENLRERGPQKNYRALREVISDLYQQFSQRQLPSWTFCLLFNNSVSCSQLDRRRSFHLLQRNSSVRSIPLTL